jgi:sortase A
MVTTATSDPRFLPASPAPLPVPELVPEPAWPAGPPAPPPAAWTTPAPDAPPQAEPETTPQAEPPESLPRTGPPAPGPVVIGLAVVMTVCVIVAFFGIFAFGLAGLQEQRSQHQLYAQFRGVLDPRSPTAPAIGGAIPTGTPVALLNAPRAGLHNAVVVEGTSSGTLLSGPGHLPDTPLPGQAGNAVLLGKSATAGAPFAGITRLHRGDVITVRTGQGNFHYVVLGQVPVGGRLPTIARNRGLLTLVTSAGGGQLGRLAPGHLVYVDAKLQGKVVGAPPGRPTSVTPSELPGHNEPSAWPWVGMWLVLLGAAIGAVWWLWSRWGILQTWLVGAPVLFAILWGLSNEGMRLLPNVS